MILDLPRLRASENLFEFAEMGYEFLVSRNPRPGWVHFAKEETALALVGQRAATIQRTTWNRIDPACLDASQLIGDAHCFIEAEQMSADEFALLLDRITGPEGGNRLCGTGFLSLDGYREVLLDRFADRISLLGTATWWVTDPIPPVPPYSRGALLMPSFQDNWRIEQNLAWRPDLTQGLDVHVFDDNYQPAESDRLAAVAKSCGWHYHNSELGEHPDYTSNTTEFSTYNRFIFESYMRLVEDYDFVVKLDTDACLLQPDWWHEIAARLHGRAALLGTFDLRPLYEVGYFWQVAWRNGLWYDVPPFPMHLQGGTYAVSKEALLRFREQGFVPGPHHDFGEDGYMSYFAQALGIELIPATTFGSWTNLKRPPLEAIRHFKAIHPLMRKNWESANFARK